MGVYHEVRLFLRRLEATVAKLGRRVDPLEGDLLHRFPARVHKKRLKKDIFFQESRSRATSTHLSQSYQPLLGTHYTTLQHEEVLIHFAVMRKTAL